MRSCVLTLVLLVGVAQANREKEARYKAGWYDRERARLTKRDQRERQKAQELLALVRRLQTDE